MILPFVGGPGALADDVARTGLGLHIDLTDIFADDAQTHQLHTAHEADDAQTPPAVTITEPCGTL